MTVDVHTQPIDPTVVAPAASPAGDLAVHVENLGKRYKIYTSPWRRAAEWASFGKNKHHEDFWALRNVNFSVAKGKSLGIIGINGSGKSTLLKIITGTAYATEGTFQVRGRVLSLLELGTGMNPLLTGRQNVINSSELLALPQGYAIDKMDQIESFAELGEFFDRPIRLYSTGMQMRLAFSMFVAFDPDVFIVDEALSVGDIFFQQKCVKRIEKLRQRGTTLLFVSHALSTVEALCDEVLVLHKGKQQHFGDKVKGISLYCELASTTIASQSREPAANSSLAEGETSPFGSTTESEYEQLPWTVPDETGMVDPGYIKMDGFCIRRHDGQFGLVAQQGQEIEIFARMRIQKDIDRLNFGLNLFDRFQQLIFGHAWLNAQMNPLSVKAGQTIYASLKVRMDVFWGCDYVLSLGASEALPDPQSPTGWDQSFGGERYLFLPRVAVISVTAPIDHPRRGWFGPANLRTSYERIIVNSNPG